MIKHPLLSGRSCEISALFLLKKSRLFLFNIYNKFIYIMRQFETIELNSDMINFLKEYSPKEKHITSLKEIRLIEDKLNIDNYRNNLRALRNSVVQFYDELIDEDPNNRDMMYAYMESMMSVTAVIDNYAYKF